MTLLNQLWSFTLRPSAQQLAKDLLAKAKQEQVEAAANLFLASDHLASCQASMEFTHQRVARLEAAVAAFDQPS